MQPVGDCALRHAFDAARGNEADSRQVAFYTRHLGADGPTLAASCGIGRLLLPLAAAGTNVHGVDPSAFAIAICEKRLAERALTAPLFRQALPDLNLPLRYAAAFIAEGAFQHIDDPLQAQRALSRLRAHMIAPATLVVELLTPVEVLHPPGAPLVEVRTTVDASGAQIAWRSETHIDIEGRRITRLSRFEMRQGRDIVAREDESSASTWYDSDEITAMLKVAGFAQVKVVELSWRDNEGDRHVAAIARM